MDLAKQESSFGDIRIITSTRVLPVHMQFSCKVQRKGSKQAVVAHSCNTTPIIVITNESQWGEAASKLFLMEAFSSPTEQLVWNQFCNVFHRFVLRLVQADFRGLTDWEFLYIHDKYFEMKPKVTYQQAKQFWEWFGQVLTTVRFKRQIKLFWKMGLIYGLISKKDCNKILKVQDPGAFIIRFSDSVPGAFAIAYSDDSEEKVKHYLIKPEDIGSNKSLADFLREKQHFKFLVHVHIASRKLLKSKKDVIFENYYVKKKKAEMEANKHGYVQNLEGET